MEKVNCNSNERLAEEKQTNSSIILHGYLSKNISSLVHYVMEAVTELVLIYFSWFGPLVILALLYISVLIIAFFKLFSSVFLNIDGYNVVSHLWTYYLQLYHRQSFIGLDNIPRDGVGALLVWYHGPLPVDYLGLVAQVYKRDGRLVHSVVDSCVSLNLVPGYAILKRLLRMVPGGRGHCVDILSDGQLLGVAPGGAREALFGEGYGLEHWGQRTGFANVALLSGAPIIPIFTEDIREAYCTMKTGQQLLRWTFEKIRQPIVPIYGGFPVKLTTHIGRPIRPTEGETASQLRQRVLIAMKGLIWRHQMHK